MNKNRNTQMKKQTDRECKAEECSLRIPAAHQILLISCPAADPASDLCICCHQPLSPSSVILKRETTRIWSSSLNWWVPRRKSKEVQKLSFFSSQSAKIPSSICWLRVIRVSLSLTADVQWPIFQDLPGGAPSPGYFLPLSRDTSVTWMRFF